jgi:hypothetical protein
MTSPTASSREDIYECGIVLPRARSSSTAGGTAACGDQSEVVGIVLPQWI